MPAKRSLRSNKKEKEEVAREEESNSSDEDVQEETAANTPSNKPTSARELRKRRREELKTRNMGVGLSISKNATSSNKIVFGDSDDNEEELVEDEAREAGDKEQEHASSDESDDDAIEEVKSSVARDKAMEQLERERETARLEKLQTKTKKRKHKQVVEQKDNEEEDFDEDFFAQVDSEMAQQRKQRKLEKQAVVPTGRHTTFVATEDEVDSQPIQSDHNIELVVLGTEAATTSTFLSKSSDSAGIEPSEASHFFARGRLADGKDQARKKGTKKKQQKDQGWKRSKKMNTLTFGRAKTKGRRGCAAANFLVKS